MSSSKIASLGSVTGRDELIIGEALATALIALEQRPEMRQPTHNMADMKMLLNSLYAPAGGFAASDNREMALHPQCTALGSAQRCA
jgi:hypothetical protein